MSRELILKLLKIDLQISVDAYDEYLGALIARAESAIKEEGIELTVSQSDAMLVEMYAAYLYRKRREDVIAMPRSLRYALNNRLMSQKGSAYNG